MSGGWGWVIWAYAVTFVVLGGYLLSLHLRTRSVSRRLGDRPRS